jgi:hypothetical protein
MISVTYVLYLKRALDRHHRNQHGDKEGRYFFFNFKFEIEVSDTEASVSVSDTELRQFRF